MTIRHRGAVLGGILSLAVLGSCDLGSSSLSWVGVWYDPDAPMTRGRVTMELRVRHESEVTGTVTFSDYALGTFEVTGVTWEEYSGVDDLYARMELAGEGSSVEIELDNYGGGLSDESLMYGSFTSGDDSCRVYTVPAGFGIPEPTHAFKAELFTVSSLAVEPGTVNRIWAIGQSESGAELKVYEVTEGTGAVTEVIALDPLPGTGMTWHNDLWFSGADASENVVLKPFDDSTYAAGPEVILQGLDAWDTAPPFAFSSDTTICAVFGMVSNTIAFHDPSTGERTGVMPGTFGDIIAVCWTGDRYLFVQGDRSGSLETIHAYGSTGSPLGSFVVPMDGGSVIASAGTDVYIGLYGGWILRIPMSEFTGS